MKVLNEMAPAMLPRLDRFDAARPGRQLGTMRPSGTLRILRTIWQAAVYPLPDDPNTPASATQRVQRAKELADGLRVVIAGYAADRNAAADDAEQRRVIEQGLLLVIYPLGALTAIVATSFAFWRSAQDARAREGARREMEQLFSMASMLQSATDRDDANHVLRGKAQYLLPGFAGALYVFNNSRDRLDWSTSWGSLMAQGEAPTTSPRTTAGHSSSASRYINMATQQPRLHTTTCRTACCWRSRWLREARSYGLLQIAAEEPARRGAAGFHAAHSPWRWRDAMSLSLSSNALRERLRNQALRDGLTGLYNRRFLEEMLERV